MNHLAHCIEPTVCSRIYTRGIHNATNIYIRIISRSSAKKQRRQCDRTKSSFLNILYIQKSGYSPRGILSRYTYTSFSAHLYTRPYINPRTHTPGAFSYIRSFAFRERRIALRRNKRCDSPPLSPRLSLPIILYVYIYIICIYNTKRGRTRRAAN